MSVTPNSTVKTSIKTQNTKITNRVTQGHNTGAITQKKETINGKTETFDYTYDNMGRFTKSCRVGIPTHQGCEAYTYDDNGNRASATVNGTSTTASYTLDDSLKVYGDNSYQYDKDGYLKTKTTPQGITSYSYGTLGELQKVVTPSKTITYLHNANNQRVAKKVDGVVIEKYLWANLTTLLAVYDKDDNLKQRFEYADSRMPVAMIDTQGTKYYLYYDQVGSLRAVTDTSHTVVKEITYDTYGNIVSDSNPTFTIPFGFAGGLYDTDTKLTRFGYRDYDAYTGKWTAKDPIGFSGGDSNLYGYVLGDPVSGFDPMGLLWGDDYGQEALEYWIGRQIQTGNNLYYIPAFLAALWTPETSTDTGLTLFPYARAIKPFAPMIMESKCVGVTSKLFGNSLVKQGNIPGILNKPGLMKIGWGGTSSNGGGWALRLGIGKVGNKSWIHQDIGGFFVPNAISNPIISNLLRKLK